MWNLFRRRRPEPPLDLVFTTSFPRRSGAYPGPAGCDDRTRYQRNPGASRPVR